MGNDPSAHLIVNHRQPLRQAAAMQPTLGAFAAIGASNTKGAERKPQNLSPFIKEALTVRSENKTRK